jgi:hypothetical protein
MINIEENGARLTIPRTETICISMWVTSNHRNESEAYQTHSQYNFTEGQPEFGL